MIANFRRLLPLLLVIFLDSFSFFIVIPILLQLYYQQNDGMLSADTSLWVRNVLTGVTIALSKFASLFSAPLIGSFSDKYGRKITLILCLGAILIGFLLPIIGIWQQSILLILLGRCCSGVGAASQPVAQAAVTDLCGGKEKAYFLSLVALMMTLSIIIGPLAGGFLADSSLVSWFSIYTPLWGAFILSLATLFLVIFFFHETMQQHSLRGQLVGLSEMASTLSRMVNQYQIGWLLLIFFFLELGWSQYYQSIFLYLHQTAHYSAQQVSVFNAYMGVLMSTGLLLLYPLLLRFLANETIMQTGMLCVCAGFFGMVIFTDAQSQWLFVPLVAVFTGITYVSLLSLISNRVAQIDQGKVMGYASTLLFTAWMLTAFNSGWLISLYVTCPLYVAAGFIFVGNIGLFFIKKCSLDETFFVSSGAELDETQLLG